VNEIDSSNIYGVKYNNDGNEIVNGCYFKAKDTVEYKSDQASIDIYDLRESSITEGSSAQEYLDDHKDGVEEFSIDISDENFGNVGLGDTVVVEIRGGNDILQFS
jgi:hypothetical protein